MQPTEQNKAARPSPMPAKQGAEENPVPIWFDAVAGLVAIGSALAGAWYTVVRNFDNRIMSHTNLYNEIRKERDAALLKISVVTDDNGKAVKRPAPMTDAYREAEAKLPREDYSQKVSDIWKKYHAQKNLINKERGLHTPWGKWRALDSITKTEAVVLGSTAAAVAVTTAATFAALRNMGHRQKELARQIDTLQDTQDKAPVER